MWAGLLEGPALRTIGQNLGAALGDCVPCYSVGQPSGSGPTPFTCHCSAPGLTSGGQVMPPQCLVQAALIPPITQACHSSPTTTTQSSSYFGLHP